MTDHDRDRDRDFVALLGEELKAAAGRQAARRRAGWRDRLPLPRLPHRAPGRAVLLVGAVALVGAGGTAGLLAARGEVGGPPTLTFARISAQQRAAGVKPLTRPVIFARGHLAYDRRPWQLVGFQTTRGLCIEIDFPEQGRAGGCGVPAPRDRRPIDWQAQLALARGGDGVILGAVDPAAASVRVRHQQDHALRQVPARVVHVRDPRLLDAMGLRRPFAYYVAELRDGYHAMRAEARDAEGSVLGRVDVPYEMSDTSQAIRFLGSDCQGSGLPLTGRPRLVSTLPPAEVRERLAALRRPQRPSDFPPRRFMDSITGSPTSATIEVDAIRLLRRAPNGDGIYLVPTTDHPLEFTPPAECLRTLTPRQRKREAMLQQRVRENARRLSLTVYAFGARSGGTATVFDLDAYRHGRAGAGSQGRRVFGMAPDGVATVAATFANGTRQVVPVRGNVWIATARGPPPHARMRSVIWRDAQGRELRRLR